MIGEISPLVQGGSVKRRVIVLHAFGAVLSAGAVGLALGVLGLTITRILPESSRTPLAVLLAASLMVAGLSDLRLIRLPQLTSDRQTPGSWLCSLGPGGAIFAWGLDLGFILRTRIPYQSALIFPLVGLITGSIRDSVLVMAMYGFARGAAVVTTVLASGSRSAETCTMYERRKETLRSFVGVLAMGLGLGMLLTAAVGS